MGNILLDNIVFLTITILFSIYFIYTSIGDAKSTISKLRTELTQPSEKSKCPDYWDIYIDSSGKMSCIDTQHIGDSSIDPDCAQQGFNSKSIYNYSDKDKCNWSTKCKIPWLGYDRLC